MVCTASRRFTEARRARLESAGGRGNELDYRIVEDHRAGILKAVVLILLVVVTCRLPRALANVVALGRCGAVMDQTALAGAARAQLVADMIRCSLKDQKFSRIASSLPRRR